MKTLRLILVAAVVTELSLFSVAHAQIYSARRLTRRVAPQQQPAPAPADPATQPAAVPAPPPAPAPVVRPLPVRVVPPVDPEKAKAAKEEALRKTVEFQKKRAEEGSESAQYELGLRYLKGEGVEKDEATGRKWLELSAKNGYSAATKKLDDLSKTSPVTQQVKAEK